MGNQITHCCEPTMAANNEERGRRSGDAMPSVLARDGGDGGDGGDSRDHEMFDGAMTGFFYYSSRSSRRY